MDKYIEKNNQLKNMYEQWLSELVSIQPEFLNPDYSNPYYTAIPYGWFDSDIRIYCIGEEGHGTWGCGKSDGIEASDFDYIQSWNWRYLSSNICPDETFNHPLYSVEEKEEFNTSPFWNRFRKLREYGPCAWSNIDKIHVLGSECALKKKDRVKLHETETKIIAKELEILQPTHVVFFGWYGISLQQEMPKLFSELYPAGLDDESVWKKSVVTRSIDGINYIVAYHPNWGSKQKGYEEWVLEEFKKTIPCQTERTKSDKTEENYIDESFSRKAIADYISEHPNDYRGYLAKALAMQKFRPKAMRTAECYEAIFCALRNKRGNLDDEDVAKCENAVIECLEHDAERFSVNYQKYHGNEEGMEAYAEDINSISSAMSGLHGPFRNVDAYTRFSGIVLEAIHNVWVEQTEEYVKAKGKISSDIYNSFLSNARGTITMLKALLELQEKTNANTLGTCKSIVNVADTILKSCSWRDGKPYSRPGTTLIRLAENAKSEADKNISISSGSAAYVLPAFLYKHNMNTSSNERTVSVTSKNENDDTKTSKRSGLLGTIAAGIMAGIASGNSVKHDENEAKKIKLPKQPSHMFDTRNHKCANCIYWDGERKTDYGKRNAITESQFLKGNCRHKSAGIRSQKNANDSCNKWEKWSELR